MDSGYLESLADESSLPISKRYNIVEDQSGGTKELHIEWSVKTRHYAFCGKDLIRYWDNWYWVFDNGLLYSLDCYAGSHGSNKLPRTARL